jgi:putative effector of murein hydrolase
MTDRYEKYHNSTRKIMQFCQLNLLTIDYPTYQENTIIGSH